MSLAVQSIRDDFDSRRIADASPPLVQPEFPSHPTPRVDSACTESNSGGAAFANSARDHTDTFRTHNKVRSESLPCLDHLVRPSTGSFPAAAAAAASTAASYEHGDTSSVAELPADAKTWTPSQLAVYLAHILRVTPRALVNDVMRFVVKSGLTGRRFLQLSDEGLSSMNINVAWRRLFSRARDKLRADCLRGRILGFTLADESPGLVGGRTRNDDLFTLFARPAHNRAAEDGWRKASWRYTTGKKSRGRVKSLAKAFEDGGGNAHAHVDDEDDGEDRTGQRRVRRELEELARIRRERRHSFGSSSSISSKDEAPASTDAVRSPEISVDAEHAAQGYDAVEAFHAAIVQTHSSQSVPAAGPFDWSQSEPFNASELEDLSGVAGSYLLPPLPEGAAIQVHATVCDQPESASDDISDTLYQTHRLPSASDHQAQHQPTSVSPDASSSLSRAFSPRTNTSPSLASSVYHDIEDEDDAWSSGGDQGGAYHFANNKGYSTALKKPGTLRGRTGSLGDFSSVRYSTFRSAGGDAQRINIKDWYDGLRIENKAIPMHDEGGTTTMLGMKSRDGTMIMVSKKQFEEMQARLSAIEEQLSATGSARPSRAHSEADKSPGSERSTFGQATGSAMSDWVRTALCEASQLTTADGRDTSWLGLGGWALAAGLGIGIVLGEAVIGKLRR